MKIDVHVLLGHVTLINFLHNLLTVIKYREEINQKHFNVIINLALTRKILIVCPKFLSFVDDI